MRKYPRAERKRPPAKAERSMREKRRFAFSVCPSPMVFATRALPPPPNMNPTHAENHDGGEDQVDRGECRFAHIVRYEKSIDHGVGGNKDHHYHGGQDETEKLFIIETGRNICVHIYFDNLKTKK